MGADVQFINNSVKVKKALNDKGFAWLYEACGELEAQTKQNSKVKAKTGQTRGSYGYAVDEAELTGYVGSNYENAVWEEFGTGEYALNGDGRKGGWWIKVGNGKNEIPISTVEKYKWPKVRRDKSGNVTHVFTYGKKPRRPLFKAFTASKSKLIRRAQEIFGGM